MNQSTLKRSPAPRGAFTVIELVAILAVILALMVLRLPALAKAERGTKIAQCASNLRQFTSAMLILAQENSDTFPANTNGFWAWDLTWDIGDQLAECGAPWQVLYCPGTAPRISDSDKSSLYDYAPGNYRVLGYALTLSGPASIDPTNRNTTLTPPYYPVGFGINARQLPSQRVLLADATIPLPFETSQGDSPAAALGRPHLSGSSPLGGNLGMLDGHVEWRKFSNMHPRTSGASSPVFWW